MLNSMNAGGIDTRWECQLPRNNDFADRLKGLKYAVTRLSSRSPTTTSNINSTAARTQRVIETVARRRRVSQGYEASLKSGAEACRRSLSLKPVDRT
jgi:hypothetical protein